MNAEQAIAAGFQERNGVEFPMLELTDSAIVTVEQMNRDGDHLSADDAASVVVPPPKILSVLLVTDGNWFLEQGLQKPAPAGVRQDASAGISRIDECERWRKEAAQAV